MSGLIHQSVMIIDFHTHLFPPFIHENRTRFCSLDPAFKLLYEAEKSRMVGAEELIRKMDEEGVDRSVVFGFPWSDPSTIQRHNDYILESVKRFPDRLIGFCCFDLSYKGAAKETQRCLNAGMMGVGELASYLRPMGKADLEGLEPVMAICRDRQLPILVHANEPVGHHYQGKAPDALAGVYRLIKRFPDNRIVLAHWGGGLFFYSLMKKEVPDLLQQVWFDTAASPFLYQTAIYAIARELIGSERILFGSDFPLIPPSRYFDELSRSGLSASDVDRIKGDNAAALLGVNDNSTSFS